MGGDSGRWSFALVWEFSFPGHVDPCFGHDALTFFPAFRVGRIAAQLFSEAGVNATGCGGVSDVDCGDHGCVARVIKSGIRPSKTGDANQIFDPNRLPV